MPELLFFFVQASQFEDVVLHHKVNDSSPFHLEFSFLVSEAFSNRYKFISIAIIMAQLLCRVVCINSSTASSNVSKPMGPADRKTW